MIIVTVGIDLAKNVFAVHGVDEAGKPALVPLPCHALHQEMSPHAVPVVASTTTETGARTIVSRPGPSVSACTTEPGTGERQHPIGFSRSGGVSMNLLVRGHSLSPSEPTVSLFRVPYRRFSGYPTLSFGGTDAIPCSHDALLRHVKLIELAQCYKGMGHQAPALHLPERGSQELYPAIVLGSFCLVLWSIRRYF